MMNKEKFLELIIENKEMLDMEVENYFSPKNILEDAMVYATDGGKRIRAFLYIQCKKMFSKEINSKDYKLALAIEFIHSYSLVHDDLPAMDNDNYRRGKESVHKKFGEDIGILTGDALLNEAAMILFNLAKEDLSYIDAGSYILNKASRFGMIDGQVLDLRRDTTYDLSYLLDVYKKKTSDLFKAACLGAAIVTGQNEEICKKIEIFAENLGLAFQIQDDLLEDSYDNELNILNVMNKQDAIKLIDEVNIKAKNAIKDFQNNEVLSYLIDYLSSRSY
ncbi:polyprenyl synthetase family protein [uncultured Anaerococcus sp.]|uniref:polyprenyl synthetase family protein n=1 Tax=uncultured Anaerococcus sp. TaxID=293428 RepID=UPI00288B2D04|nr:polyprenyl synthetase family protein [uncultured Anaerococcus sp.]